MPITVTILTLMTVDMDLMGTLYTIININDFCSKNEKNALHSSSKDSNVFHKKIYMPK